MSQTSEIPSTVHTRNDDSLSSSALNTDPPRSDAGENSAALTRSELPAVSVRDATKTFVRPDLSPIEAVDAVSMDVALGEFVVIVGPSGCGKSTLLNIIAGLVEPDSGTVGLEGDNEAQRIGRVAYMHQIDLLLPWRNVLSNATLGLEIAGIPRADADAKATELAQRFGIADFLNAYPATLSGGMRQRVALLRAVLPERDVLLLDEPFKALDAITRAELQRWLSDVLDRTNRATVMVTHDVEEALMLGDRVLVMSPRPGRIVLELDVDLPRPRPRDIVRDSKFVDYKWQLLSALDDDLTR
ncbi:MAG: ABC transporter ATP-binding protein [Chloroflexi bacterium]|nr:ABC transporter ATP-binding protein [Chloroflexota bacterium]